MNTVNLIGNVGQAPEYTHFVSGKRNARINIAVNMFRANQEPMWIRCEFWEQAAENLEKCNVKKGTKIAVTGSLVPNNWEKKVGDTVVKMNSYFVRASSFDVLTPKGETQSDEPDEEELTEDTAMAATMFAGKSVKSRKN